MTTVGKPFGVVFLLQCFFFVTAMLGETKFLALHNHKGGWGGGDLVVSVDGIQWRELPKPKGNEEHSFTITCLQLQRVARPNKYKSFVLEPMLPSAFELDVPAGKYVFYAAPGNSAVIIMHTIARSCAANPASSAWLPNSWNTETSTSAEPATSAPDGKKELLFDVRYLASKYDRGDVGILYVSPSGVKFGRESLAPGSYDDIISCADIVEVKLNNRFNLGLGFIIKTERSQYQYIAATDPKVIKEAIADECSKP